jgi:hypothetical protein
MLRITESESAAAAKQYYCCSLNIGDYYFDKQEIVGVWGGVSARQLGLDGRVEQDAFLKLIDNLRPDGTPLTARTVDNRRPGYDFTFDVPKSVSLVHALEHDERIPVAMRYAVDETMREIEAEMYTRVRKHGASDDRRTGNMLWADFTHFTSRPAPLNREAEAAILKENPWMQVFADKAGRLFVPDPHLHMHVYAVNATFDPVERQWKAGEFMRIKRDASYYQAAYHSRLARELQKLGYEIEPVGRAFEIRGVPRSMVEVFSRRTKEVEDAARELGITDAKAKAELGAKTRRRKNKTLTRSELGKVWASLATRKERDALQEIAKHSQGRMMVMDSPEAALASVKYALGCELERVSEVSEKRLLATALERAVGRAGVGTVRDALNRTPEILRAEINGEKRLTTAGILAEESALMDVVRNGRGRVRRLVEGEYLFINPLFQGRSKEADEQKAAIRHVLQSQDWIVGVVGRAGTGKTTLLKEISAGVNGTGRNLVLCAPTAEAARSVLRGEGFAQADTVKHLLGNAEMQAQLRGGVLWIDEAGMLGNRDMMALLNVARKEGAARVVLAGDYTQIRSVPRGDAFRFLEENAGLRVARLENIRRQKTPEMKAAVEAISRGEVDKGMGLLDKQGSIVVGDTQATQKALAKAYAEAVVWNERRGAKKSALVVCPTHREGEAVTLAIREELREAGQIARGEQAISRVVNLSWTDAEKRNPAAYYDGLAVEFKQNEKGFRRGERVTVSAIDAREGRVMVVKTDLTEVPLPLNHAEKFQVYRMAELNVARGDRMRITENGFDKAGTYRLNNGATFTVDGFTPSGDIIAENGKVIAKDYGHINHGYVVTADAAQSKTVDTVFAAVGHESLSATDMRRMYVTISRAREDVKVFTDDRDGLMLAAKRDTERRFATELVGRERSREIIQRIAREQAHKSIEAQRVKAQVIEQREQRKPHIERSIGIGI